MSEITKEERTITRPIPVNFYQVPQAESWLSQMGSRGWMLTEAGRFFCTFVQRTPTRCRYRLEPRGKKDPDGEFIEACALDGWEYVACWRETFTIWRAEGEEAPEFHTDPVAQYYAFQKLSRKMTWNMAFSLPLTLVLIAAIGYSFHNQPVLRLTQDDFFSQFPLWLTALWTDVLALLDWRAIRKLTQQLKAGESFSHNVPLRKSPRFLFYLLLIGVTLFSICLPFYAISRSHTVSASRFTDLLPLPRLVELETGQLRQEEAFVIDGVDYANAIFTDWALLAPVQYTLVEQGNLDPRAYDDWKEKGSPQEEIPVTYRASYYKLRPSFLSEQLLKELAEQLQKRIEGLSLIPQTGFAHTVWYGKLPGGQQFLLLAKDGQVVSMEYCGPESLLERMDIILQKLSIGS